MDEPIILLPSLIIRPPRRPNLTRDPLYIDTGIVLCAVARCIYTGIISVPSPVARRPSPPVSLVFIKGLFFVSSTTVFGPEFLSALYPSLFS